MRGKKERGRGGEGRGRDGTRRDEVGGGTEAVGKMGTEEGEGEVVGKGRSQYFLLGLALTTTGQKLDYSL